MADIAIFNPDSINTPRAPYSHVAEVGAGAKHDRGPGGDRPRW